MKNLLPILLLALALMLPGCAWTKRHFTRHHDASTAKPGTNSKSQKQTPAPSHVIVTPDDSLAAKVLKVNEVGRFVVLNFPAGRMPKLDQHFFLYRGGLKIAEVKVVGPQQETSIVADILSGDAQAGDTVREE